MDKKNKLLFGMLFLFGILASLSLVSATISVTLNSPAADVRSACEGGVTTHFNVSITGFVDPADADEFVNITYYAQSTLTANSSWVVIGSNDTVNLSSAIATTANQSVIGIALDQLEDANNYIFNVTVQNVTSGNFIMGGDDNTGQTVDCTVPTAATLSPVDLSEITTSTNQTFTGTVTDSETTSCTYTIARGGATSGSDYTAASGTYSADSCTFSKSFTSSTDNGLWTWIITASDETNTTDSSATFSVAFPGPGGGLPGGELPGAGCATESPELRDSCCVGLGLDSWDDATASCKDKSSAGWIIGIIFGVFVVIGAVVAARR